MTMVIVRAKFLNKQTEVHICSLADVVACNKEIAEQMIAIDIPLAHYCKFVEIPDTPPLIKGDAETK